MLRTEGLSLAAFALSYAMLAAVPGPNFLAVSHASLGGRAAGLSTATGVACGASLLAAIAFAGFAVVVLPPQAVPLLALVYGAVLLRAGLGCIRPPAGNPRAAAGCASRRRPFRFGFVVAALNPVSFAFFASAAGRAGAGSPAEVAGCVGAVFAVALGWFGAVGLILSAPVLRAACPSRRRWSDLGIGVILIGLGGITLVEAAAAIQR